MTKKMQSLLLNNKAPSQVFFFFFWLIFVVCFDFIQTFVCFFLIPHTGIAHKLEQKTYVSPHWCVVCGKFLWGFVLFFWTSSPFLLPDPLPVFPSKVINVSFVVKSMSTASAENAWTTTARSKNNSSPPSLPHFCMLIE